MSSMLVSSRTCSSEPARPRSSLWTPASAPRSGALSCGRSVAISVFLSGSLVRLMNVMSRMRLRAGADGLSSCSRTPGRVDRAWPAGRWAGPSSTRAPAPQPVAATVPAGGRAPNSRGEVRDRAPRRSASSARRPDARRRRAPRCTGRPRSSATTAGAGTGSSPCAVCTTPSPSAGGEATTRSGARWCMRAAALIRSTAVSRPLSSCRCILARRRGPRTRPPPCAAPRRRRRRPRSRRPSEAYIARMSSSKVAKPGASATLNDERVHAGAARRLDRHEARVDAGRLERRSHDPLERALLAGPGARQVEQRGDQHVAADAVRAVEVEDHRAHSIGKSARVQSHRRRQRSATARRMHSPSPGPRPDPVESRS